jgi:hypothetical protein
VRCQSLVLLLFACARLEWGGAEEERERRPAAARLVRRCRSQTSATAKQLFVNSQTTVRHNQTSEERLVLFGSQQKLYTYLAEDKPK